MKGDGGRWRASIDIGGTFTDVVLWRTSAPLSAALSTKVLTTHAAPSDAALAGLRTLAAGADVAPAEIALVLHGTTLATNALIERRGARTALITTRGFRDVLEMAHENRFEQYDVSINRPQPLVGRAQRFEITERMAADGSVLVPLAEDELELIASQLESEAIEAVAIALLHEYVNDSHARQIQRFLAKRLPGLSITLASEVCPEIREYERTSTAVANAYVRPLMDGYLEDFEQRLTAWGVSAPMLLMTSGGGLTTVDTARRFPIRLVESGPAGGAVLARELSRARSLSRVLSFDMGGTTAKLCLIDDFEPVLSRAFEIDRSYRFMKGSGLPVRIPVIDMVEIGAGGGSIAQLDALGRLRVGPASAGSEPGPACYGRGGEHATVTDADAVLGYLDPERFAQGKLTLDVAAASLAVARLGRQPEESGPTFRGESPENLGAAQGIRSVVDEGMAAAARAHSAETGSDLSSRTLIAFGGAAPLHAISLASKLNISRVLIPGGAGVGSALGFLLAPVSFEVVRSKLERLSALNLEQLAELLAQMRSEAAAVVGSAAPDEPLTTNVRAYMRYCGQGSELSVPVNVNEHSTDGGLDAESLRSAFEARYENLFGRTVPGVDVEILSWTLQLSAAGVVLPALADGDVAVRRGTAVGSRDCAFATAGSQAIARRSPTPIFERVGLSLAEVLEGPALIAEAQTTTVVPAGWIAQVAIDGSIELTHGELS